MSTYDDASLVMIPSGYKTGTVFSQKPMSTDGQLTFTRSNDTATRVASNGLIEKVRTNLLLQSQTFQTTWAPQNSTVSIDVTTAPDGTLTADKLVENSVATAQHRIDQTSVSASGSLTFSVYAKKEEREKIFLRIGLLGAYFDLNTGTIFSIDIGIVATISNAGNGWYRCAISKAASISNEIVRINLVDATNSITYNGDGVSGAFIWGAQYELNDIATDYIPTTTAAVSVGPVANVPRLDYLGSTCPRLLLEPQRTNVITFSESFDNAAWIKENATITANSVTSPNGYQDADTLTDNATNDRHRVRQGSVSFVAGTTYTTSVFVKKNSPGRFLLINVNTGASAMASLNLDTLAVNNISGTSKLENYGNGWYRFSVTGTAATTQTNNVLIQMQNSNADASYVGNGSSFYLWGAQCEVGSYPTSYIPTLAASVTRGADVCVKTSISSLIGQTEGTVFIDAIVTNFSDAAQSFITVSDGTINNRIELRKGSPANILLEGAASTGSFPNINLSSAPLGRYKIAVAYKTGDTALFINGLQIGSTSTNAFAFPSLANVVLGANFSGSTRFLNDSISQALLFKTRLPNSELASLTTL